MNHTRWILTSLFLFSLGTIGCTSKQATFASPDEAIEQLRIACESGDPEELRRIFGPDVKKIGSGDERQDRLDVQRLAAALARERNIVEVSSDEVVIKMDGGEWDFPVPLVKEKGKWSFDTAAGAEAVADIRVGANELDAIRVCRNNVVTQKEYFEMDPDGDGVKTFAQRIISSPGRRDGLWWPDEDGMPRSPLGPGVARAAAAEEIKLDGGPQSYRGYRYKILTGQGSSADGGVKSYLDSAGRMTGGFALIAWPADYGNSGIMTFIVNQKGVVLQRDFGKNTNDVANAVKSFDPTASWTAAE